MSWKSRFSGVLQIHAKAAARGDFAHVAENTGSIEDSLADDGVRFELLSGILAILAGKRGFLEEL
jgi:hypothetical protein